MSNFGDLVAIRLAIPEDYNFIYASWLRGLYYGDSWFSLVPKDIFMEHYKKVITSLLENPSVKVLVACLPDDPYTIVGYSVSTMDEKAVVWVFVKKAWRNKGIGRVLLPKEPQYATLLTDLGKTLLPKLPTATFNPFYGA